MIKFFCGINSDWEIFKRVPEKGVLEGSKTSPSNDIASNKNKILKPVHENLTKQASFFSEDCRKIVWTLIAAIGFLAMCEDIKEINRWLVASFISCLFYLAIDVIHSFWQTCYFMNKSKKIRDKNEFSSAEMHKESDKISSHNQNFFYFVYIRFAVIFFAVATFIVGLCNTSIMEKIK